MCHNAQILGYLLGFFFCSMVTVFFVIQLMEEKKNENKEADKVNDSND